MSYTWLLASEVFDGVHGTWTASTSQPVALLTHLLKGEGSDMREMRGREQLSVQAVNAQL